MRQAELLRSPPSFPALFVQLGEVQLPASNYFCCIVCMLGHLAVMGPICLGGPGWCSNALLDERLEYVNSDVHMTGLLLLCAKGILQLARPERHHTMPHVRESSV